MKATRWIGMAVVAAWCLAGSGVLASEDTPRRSAPRAQSKAESKGEATADKININAASKTELMKLEGVGSGTAQKIIAYREAHGPFKRPQDLGKVDGVGKGVLDKNAGRITVK